MSYAVGAFSNQYVDVHMQIVLLLPSTSCNWWPEPRDLTFSYLW